MIKNARQILKGTKNASLEVADVVLYDFDFSELIAAYYTVQFTFPEFRQEVISKIYLALNWGGAFILFEKVRGADARFKDIMTTL